MSDEQTTKALTDALAAIDLADAKLTQLSDVLRRVLGWPLPQGTVETYSLPPWLAKEAREALDGVAR